MTQVFHAGELAVQTRARGQQMAQRVGKGIHAAVSLAVQHFLHAQQMAVVSSVDTRGRVWVSLLTGEPGFIHSVELILRLAETLQPTIDNTCADWSFGNGEAPYLLLSREQWK
jgi:predicted pyridoxine 5'-phosphate oxidase superfamily flavin-nucleotide-binding protein